MDKNNSKDATCKGYTLFGYAGPTPSAYLIDMGGNVVHEWSFGGMPVKMLPGGSILGRKRNRMGKDPLKKDPGADPKAEPGPHRPPWQDTIEFVQVDWDSREEWSYANWDDDGTGVMMSRQHHDCQREGNPVGYYAPGQDFVEEGKTLILSHKDKVVPGISDKVLLDDVIYEVDWNGNLTGYEWHAADHYDEYGFDETGDERFNPENIIISSRHANFIAILSRATGKIAWKAGPDFTAGTPENNLGQFVGQHHAHMIPRGLPGAGNILVFDNGGESGYGGPEAYPRYTREYSRVIELDPVTFEIIWQYGAESGKEHFFSHFISGAQRLPNGNTMVTDGANGRLFEVTAAKEIVWEYTCEELGEYDNLVYRAYRVPPEWVPGNPAGYAEWPYYMSHN